MQTINGYIIRNTLRPLFIAIVIALLLLLVERMLRLLNLVLDSQGSLDVLVKLLVFLVPHYLGLALPAAFFIGLMLTFTRMNADSELDALGSAGVGLHQLLWPAMALALALTILSAATFSHLQPYARYTYRAVIHTLKNGPLNYFLQDGIFIEAKDTTYMAEQIDSGHQRFLRVFAFREDKTGKRAAMTARSGQLLIREDDEGSLLVLKQGLRMDIEAAAENGIATTGEGPPGASTFAFDELHVPVSPPQAERFRPRGQDEREFTLPELWKLKRAPAPAVSENERRAEFHDRAVRILSVLFLPFLALPLSLGGRRANRSYGMAVGLIILMVYSKLLDAGHSFTQAGTLGPLTGQWLPLVGFALFSLAIFYNVAFTVRRANRFAWLRMTGDRIIGGLRRGPRKAES